MSEPVIIAQWELNSRESLGDQRADLAPTAGVDQSRLSSAQ
jgi:hypothetical protein